MKRTDPQRRNSLGDIVGSWSVTIRYDEASDSLIVTKQRPATRWLKSAHGATQWPVDEVEAALESVCRSVRTYGARRLF